MGAWGYGTFDNDSALDIKANFEGYIKEGKTTKETTEILLEDLYDHAMELTAIYELQLKHQGFVDENIKEMTKFALKGELKEVDDLWAEPELRRKYIKEFLKKM